MFREVFLRDHTYIVCVVRSFFDIILAFRPKIRLAVSAAALINAGSNF